MSFILISPTEQYLGAAVADQDKVFVLRDQRGLWFREWMWNRVQRNLADVRFVAHLACARGFLSKQLCESFQCFLRERGFPTQIVEVDSNRLIRAVSNPERQA
jgi:hypothetical protein